MLFYKQHVSSQITVAHVIEYPRLLEHLLDAFDSIPEFSVVFQVKNGLQLQNELTNNQCIPDLVMIDIDLRGIDALETTIWLQDHHPSVKPIALVKNENQRGIISMLRAGCCSYLCKYASPGTLKTVLLETNKKRYFNPAKMRSPVSIFRKHKETRTEDSIIALSEEEKEFLRMACTELSYEQIRFETMMLKDVGDAYIDSLFRKFDVDNRAGLVLEYLKGGRTIVQGPAWDNFRLFEDGINRLLRRRVL